MKKFLQISLVIVLMFTLLQAVVGVTFVAPEKTASYENVQHAAASASGQNVEVQICSSSCLAHGVRPNVGWNS